MRILFLAAAGVIFGAGFGAAAGAGVGLAWVSVFHASPFEAATD
jgi:hypothetical protein